MKVLVIEDEKMVAESIRAILESKGFEVETVYDGEAGTEYAELGIYDLLILDVMMPKLNGFQVARQVQHAHSDAHRPLGHRGPHSGPQRRCGLLFDKAL